MSDLAIKMERVSKQYRLGQAGYRSLREDIVNIFKARKEDSQCFYALREVSFELKRGETVGIIGPNGAGKSTILKLLAGVTIASSGTVMAEGKIGALIELSAGFHPELTGRENIFLNAALLGHSQKEIIAKLPQIIEFAEVHGYIDAPLRTYSTGMVARLGFAIATAWQAEILILDEILAVGDEE